jgi:hypothetical protein
MLTVGRSPALMIRSRLNRAQRVGYLQRHAGKPR